MTKRWGEGGGRTNHVLRLWVTRIKFKTYLLRLHSMRSKCITDCSADGAKVLILTFIYSGKYRDKCNKNLVINVLHDINRWESRTTKASLVYIVLVEVLKMKLWIKNIIWKLKNNKSSNNLQNEWVNKIICTLIITKRNILFYFLT